jgi:hypothetical protein
MKAPWRSLALAAALLAGGLAAAGADADQATGPRCEIAVVNPVSNYAECVKPRGAHVDPPPKRATPTPEQCQRHPDIDVEDCRQYPRPPDTDPRG